MNAGTYNITIENGATFSLVLTWKDEDGHAINLTGYTARMQIRETKESDTLIKELSTANGGITLGGEAGTITLSISATDTEAITQETGVYDLELVSGGTVTRLLEGTVTFSTDVTR